MSAPRSVVLAGATGFIGGALAARLVGEGAQVHCVVRTSSRTEALERLGRIRFLRIGGYTCDELDRYVSTVQPDIIYNLASYGVRPEDRDPGAMLDGNIGVASALVQFAARCGARRFVQIGSCSEYAQTQDGKLLDEDHAIAPISLYGAAKAASTVYSDALALSMGVPFVTLRMFGVYGTDEAPYRLIPYLIDRLARDEEVDLTSGEQFRDLLFIDDVVEALLAVTGLSGERRVYNVCSGAPLRIRDVAEAVCMTLGKPLELLRFGKRQYRPDEWMWIVGDNRRYCAASGWRPRVSLGEGLQRMLAARVRRPS